MPDPQAAAAITQVLEARFGERLAVDPALDGLDTLARLAARRVHRRWTDKPVDPALLRLLCACALSSPSKSDLQQGDIVIVSDRSVRSKLEALLPDNPWVTAAPVFLVFCGNGSRMPQISALRGKPYPNDHLDAFFNAVVDGAIQGCYTFTRLR